MPCAAVPAAAARGGAEPDGVPGGGGADCVAATAGVWLHGASFVLACGAGSGAGGAVASFPATEGAAEVGIRAAAVGGAFTGAGAARGAALFAGASSSSSSEEQLSRSSAVHFAAAASSSRARLVVVASAGAAAASAAAGAPSSSSLQSSASSRRSSSSSIGAGKLDARGQKRASASTCACGRGPWTASGCASAPGSRRAGWWSGQRGARGRSAEPVSGAAAATTLLGARRERAARGATRDL